MWDVGKRKRLNELPVEVGTRKPINANCLDASYEDDSCPETRLQPPFYFQEATKQLLEGNSVHLLLTWSVLKLMATLHPSLFKHPRLP